MIEDFPHVKENIRLRVFDIHARVAKSYPEDYDGIAETMSDDLAGRISIIVDNTVWEPVYDQVWADDE